MKVPGKLCKKCFSYIGKPLGNCPACGYSHSGDTEPSVLPLGTKLGGRYILGGSIGRGGFGMTYLAYDTLGKKTVAVKEYFPAALAHRGRGSHVIPNSEKSAEQFNIGAEKFFDEAELVRRFNGNPNIVSIYECFYKNNTAYYVMEYLDGITLENYVQNYGALNSSQALYIADKLTMALMVLHSGEVLHRDISPDNVMLCRDGSVKLIDFGAARQFLADGSAGYTVIMKTGFSPAEQYLQNSDTDIRVDIYSVGTLMYYALTGKVPKSPYKRMENDSEFAEKPDDADNGLWSVIGKAAAIKPSERFGSAEELRSALTKLDLNATAIAVPEDYNSFKKSGAEYEKPDKRLSKVLSGAIAVCAVVLCAMIALVGAARRTGSVPKVTELTLDSEYKGNFNIGGVISSEELRRFGGDVEITIHIEPYENMPSNDIHGIIPVNSDDRSILEYLTAPEVLWADENGWINIEKGKHSLTFSLSREGIESLGDGGLGFETYNLIITSAVLKPSERQKPILISSYKQRNAPYYVVDGEDGKVITVELDDYSRSFWGGHESQSIPKSAFYEFDGDVKVTITVSEVDDETDKWNVVYVCNAGFCVDVFDDDVLVPMLISFDGKPLVSRVDAYGVLLNSGCTCFIFIIPQYVKEKMSEGVFFQSTNLRVTGARLEAYDGGYSEFIQGGGI